MLNHPQVLMAAGPFLAALAGAVAIGPPMAKALGAWKLGQVIRQEGPEAHLAKAGTPSMGGWVFLIPGLAAALAFTFHEPKAWLWAAATLAFTLVGWLDDYLVVKKQHNKGLKPRHKLAGQVLAGAALAGGLYLLGHEPKMLVPFSQGTWSLDLPWWVYGPFLAFVLTSYTNAVNLTDGLDGLASGTAAIAFLGLAALCAVAAPFAAPVVVPAALAMAGACIGFLWINAHPAQAFMGDTGSLGLGAAIATLAALAHLELFLVPLGLVFVAETLSVMAQVAYFKHTKKRFGEGKRLLRMSPLHHHFELGGLKETKVVARFYVATAICAAATLLLG